MSTRKLPLKGTPEWDKEVTFYNSSTPESRRKRAKELGYSSADKYNRLMRSEGIPLPSQKTPESYKPISEVIASDTAESRLKAESNHYKKLYLELQKQSSIADILKEAMHEVAAIVPPIIVKTYSTPNRPVDKKRGSETNMLQLSDVHSGEVVRAEETMGICEYNMEIMNRRLGMLFRKTLELIEIRRSSLYIPKLRINEGGDMLSGDIHEELIKTNVGQMMTIATRTAFIISQGIAFLSPHFDSIDVDCVVGNHPRLTKKPSFKQKYINWDYLCYQWQAIFCKGLKNVHFHIPQTPFALFDVENTRILSMHGDVIRSWMGIPWYGIERTSLKMRELLQTIGEKYDSLSLFHFHQDAALGRATGPIIINGSVKGGDEFSIGSLQSSNRPSQNLIHFHEKNGYIGGSPIYLDEADDRGDLAFQDILTEIWADMEI